MFHCPQPYDWYDWVVQGTKGWWGKTLYIMHLSRRFTFLHTFLWCFHILVVAVVWFRRGSDRQAPFKTGVAISAQHSREIRPGTALKITSLRGRNVLFFMYLFFWQCFSCVFCWIRCCVVCAQTQARPTTGYHQHCSWSIWTQRKIYP